MTHFSFHSITRLRQAGLTLIELMVSIAISATVLAGVVSVLLVSKSNFINQRELSGVQENARFAMKYMGDEIRLAGNLGGCRATIVSNDVINTSATTAWYLGSPGLAGYEYDAGIGTFPSSFSASVRANTDAIVVRRGERTGLFVSITETVPTITLTTAHSYQIGQPFVITSADCEFMGVFQMSGPANGSNTATTISHATGTATPGNCSTAMQGPIAVPVVYTCSGGVTSKAPGTAGNAIAGPFTQGANLMELHSEAYFIGNSTSDSTVPALFRARVLVSGSAATVTTEELVQGVENMQILYGVDKTDITGGATATDNLADQYYKGNLIPAGKKVVSVRISLRMRSIAPVYNENVAYPVFEGVTGTGGSDRYMRQYAATTIMVRNF